MANKLLSELMGVWLNKWVNTVTIEGTKLRVYNFNFTILVKAILIFECLEISLDSTVFKFKLVFPQARMPERRGRLIDCMGKTRTWLRCSSVLSIFFPDQSSLNWILVRLWQSTELFLTVSYAAGGLRNRDLHDYSDDKMPKTMSHLYAFPLPKAWTVQSLLCGHHENIGLLSSV
jgi:hypothetical protein